jgi:hypothetical protein
MFLAAKAAHNWSQAHGQPLKAAVNLQGDSEDELDDLALEQYLEWRQDLFDQRLGMIWPVASVSPMAIKKGYKEKRPE